MLSILVLLACTPESSVRSELESDGHTDIRLVRDGPGDFRYMSKKGNLHCSGHYSSSDHQSFCGPAPCLPENSSQCIDRADSIVARAPWEGLHYIQIACAAGNGDGCNRVALWPIDGKIPKLGDPMPWAERSCGMGNMAGCTNRGLIKFNNQDIAGAKSDFELSCGKDDDVGCGNLAVLYGKGLGVEADEVKASELYTRACELGRTADCSVMGIRHARGIGVEKNPQLGLEMLQKGCETKDARACFMLHSEQANGNVPGNPADGVAGMIAACEGGDGSSCTEAGFFLERGVGGRKDPKRARSMYHQGCEVGDGLGCNNYGICLENGIGGPKDRPSAGAWFEKACKLGFQKACNE